MNVIKENKTKAESKTQLQTQTHCPPFFKAIHEKLGVYGNFIFEKV